VTSVVHHSDTAALKLMDVKPVAGHTRERSTGKQNFKFVNDDRSENASTGNGTLLFVLLLL